MKTYTDEQKKGENCRRVSEMVTESIQERESVWSNEVKTFKPFICDFRSSLKSLTRQCVFSSADLMLKALSIARCDRYRTPPSQPQSPP